MKLPNQFGTVTKLSGNRRKPWRVREGKSGKQRTIGYAATYEEALLLLSNYNQNPWNIDTNKITMEQLFDLWTDKKMPKLGTSNSISLKAAYKHCSLLHNCQYNKIKAYQMQNCIDKCGLGASSQANIKNLFWHLDRFALELDIVSKCYSDLLTTETPTPKQKEIFTAEEIQKCWDNIRICNMDTVIFLLYTGFRISEMLDIKTENVDLQNQIIQGGTKTAAGKNRIVPIHSKIKTIVENRYRMSRNGYLFEQNQQKFSDVLYRKSWADLTKVFDIKHTPHDCRHTFRSRLDSAGANKVCIDLMMGHKTGNVGERVYTHKTINELRQSIELIK